MLRGIFGFDHLLKNTVDTWLANCGYGIGRLAAESTSGKGLIVNDAGALSTPAGTATTRTVASFDLSTFLGANGQTQVTCGCRIANPGTVAPTGADGAIYFSTDTTAGTAMLTFSQAGFSLTNAIAVWYPEFTFDLTAGTWGILWGGATAYYYTGTLSAAQIAAIKAGTLRITIHLASANVNQALTIRDFYVLDDVAGDGFTKRLGPRRIAPLPLADAVGDGWTSSSSQSLLATLNASPEVASPGLVVSPASSTTQLLGTLSSNIAAGSAIEAVQVQVSAQASVAGTVLKSNLKNGSALTAVKNSTLTAALKYGYPVGVFPRNPDGTAWTNANVNTTQVAISPDL